jgi:hypothetical protein
MPERNKLFLKILKAELEDCLEDVEDLTNLYERRQKRRDHQLRLSGKRSAPFPGNRGFKKYYFID